MRNNNPVVDFGIKFPGSVYSLDYRFEFLVNLQGYDTKIKVDSMCVRNFCFF